VTGHYLCLGCEAMATRFEVWLKPEERAALPVVREAFNELRTIERRFSLFRPESELAQLNGGAQRGPVAVADDLFGLLQLARRIGELSAGVYDVTTGALSRCWGLLERRGRIPSARELALARSQTGWQHVRFDEEARTVAFSAPGIELNLGSLGKGYALDRLAARLERAGVGDFLAHAGGSTILARGRALDGSGWPVAVRPATGTCRTEHLYEEALSTSGSSEQMFEVNGRRFSHILDPRSGEPSARVGTVSAIARSGVMAEVVSTALFLLDGLAVERRLLAATGARRCA
jgi:FAD:protein FMN transferase